MKTSARLIGRMVSIAIAGLWRPSFKNYRRLGKRYKLDLPIRFRLYLPSHLEPSSPFFTAQIYDLYEHGMGLLADVIEWEGFHILHFWPKTLEQCLLEIQIPCRGEIITLKGKAVWYLKQPKEEPYAFRIGIQFLDLTRELKVLIRDVIHLNSCIDEAAV